MITPGGALTELGPRALRPAAVRTAALLCRSPRWLASATRSMVASLAAESRSPRAHREGWNGALRRG
jgi:hypothetical protein